MADQFSILQLTETDPDDATFETQDAEQFEEMSENGQLDTPKKSGAAKALVLEQTSEEKSESTMETTADKEVPEANVGQLLNDIYTISDDFNILDQAFLAGYYHQSPEKVTHELEDIEIIESPQEPTHEMAEEELRAQIGDRPISELHGQMLNIGGQSVIVKVVNVSASVSPDTPMDPDGALLLEQTSKKGEKTPTKEDSAQNVLIEDTMDTPAKTEEFLSRPTRARHPTKNYDNLKSRANWGQQHLLSYVNTHGLDRNGNIPAEVVESGMKDYALDTRAMKRKQRKLNSRNGGRFVKLNEVQLTLEEVMAEDRYGHWSLPLEATSDD